MILDIITGRTAMIIAAVAGGVLALYLICRIYRKSAERKRLRQLAEDRKREETLDMVLRNAPKGRRETVSESIPYEVDYSKNGKRVGDSGSRGRQVMIRLVEHNELSLRKHMLSLEKRIRIGSSMEGNSIVVAGICPYQCEIFQYRGEVYLRDVGEERLTVLRRKKKAVYAEEKGIRMRSGDRIILGRIYFDVTIVK